MNAVQPRITKATLARLQWPDSCLRSLACSLVKRFIEAKEPVWFDDVAWSLKSTTSPRLICAAWRGLMKDRVLVNTGQRRRSSIPDYMEASIACFALSSREIGLAFLKANDGSIEELQQRPLFRENTNTGERVND
jgi:hypothetical protein